MKNILHTFNFVTCNFVEDKFGNIHRVKHVASITAKHLTGAIRQLYATCTFDDIVSVNEVA